MSLEAELYARLTADGGVSALVVTRVYPDVLPQGVTYPAIRYQRISTARLYNLGGKADQADTRFQIDCYATTRIGAIALADAVRAALDSQTGLWGSIAIRNVTTENETADLEPGVEPKIYNQRLEFFIIHTEA